MSFREAVLDIFFPPKCAFCGALLPTGSDGICADCRKTLPFAPEKGEKPEFTASLTAPLYYDETVRRAVLSCKFGNRPSVCRAFGVLIAEKLREHRDDFDVITWVPLSRARRRKRGYDQAKLIAESVGRELGTRVEPLLRKERDNPPQSGIRSPEQRRANVSGMYAVADPAAVKGKSVLLLDDVVTTGATLAECARMLRLAGAREVHAAASARSMVEKEKTHVEVSL